MSSRGCRGFFFVKSGKEMFVPQNQINRFFEEWTFPGHEADVVRRCAAAVLEQVASYKKKKERVCFMVDETNYLNLFVSPVDSVSLTDMCEYAPLYYGQTEIRPEDW